MSITDLFQNMKYYYEISKLNRDKSELFQTTSVMYILWKSAFNPILFVVTFHPWLIENKCQWYQSGAELQNKNRNMASAKSAVGQHWATSSSVSPLRLLIACGQSGSNPGTQVSASVCGCLCVFLLFPDRRKDSFHPKHAFLEKAGGPCPWARREGPSPDVPCYQWFPRLASLGKAGWTCSKISITCIIVLTLPESKHTMKTTATATISSPSLNTKAALSHSQTAFLKPS